MLRAELARASKETKSTHHAQSALRGLGCVLFRAFRDHEPTGRVTLAIFEYTGSCMESILLKAKSKENLMLLVSLAEKLGIETVVISEEMLEDLGLTTAILAGRTGELVDTEDFLKSLEGGSED